jgi:hypothetical protein
LGQVPSLIETRAHAAQTFVQNLLDFSFGEVQFLERSVFGLATAYAFHRCALSFQIEYRLSEDGFS